jgi:hypothetical protein
MQSATKSWNRNNCDGCDRCVGIIGGALGHVANPPLSVGPWDNRIYCCCVTLARHSARPEAPSNPCDLWPDVRVLMSAFHCSLAGNGVWCGPTARVMNTTRLRPLDPNEQTFQGLTERHRSATTIGGLSAEFAKIGEALVATGLPSAKDAARAYFARNGQPYSAKSVRAMLAQRLPRGPCESLPAMRRQDGLHRHP